MKKVALALALLLPTAAQAQDEFGEYHALVIGNDDYQHLETLKTAVADAEAVGKLLEEEYVRQTFADYVQEAFRKAEVSGVDEV